MKVLPPPIYFLCGIYIETTMRKKPDPKKKTKRKKTKRQKEEDYHQEARAEHYDGDEKYSLIEQMMKALKYDECTDTGLNAAGILVKDLCTGVPLHFSPNSASVVTCPDDEKLYNDFTFDNTGFH